MHAEQVVRRIVLEDAMHRKGTRPSQWSNIDVIEHLESEVKELRDELELLEDCPSASVAYRAALELADTYAVVLSLANRLGLSLLRLDALAVEKLHSRFNLQDPGRRRGSS